MSKKDHIDVIVEVEKFNPFHDAQGRFSNKNGFATYSANPNTRAGAMAIARSAAAGHGSTANVHREATSTGPTIRHNANWLGSGNQLNSRWQGSGTLRNRVEPVNGLRGASNMGSMWQTMNQARGKTTKPGSKQKPQPSQQQQQPQSKPAQQKPQPQQQKPAAPKTNARTPVDGKDISSTFKYNSRAKGDPLDQVAEQQGFKGKPQVIADRTQFSAAVKASGVMAYRTIAPGTDTVTGKRKTGAQFADDLKNSDAFSHNGTGGKVYGAGIYIAATQNPVKGRAPSRSSTDAAKTDSKMYGGGGSKTVAMTLDPSAKIGDYQTVRSQFRRLSATQKAKYGNDMAAYAASKGFDGLKAVDAGWGCDYITVYNRTKLVIFDG